MKCPKCGGRLYIFSTRMRADGSRRRRYSCPAGCGSFSSVEFICNLRDYPISGEKKK